MPPLAIAGVAAAAIGGVATIAASNKNSKAIKQATAAQDRSAADQIRFQQQARAENTANLSPWMQRGNTAGETIMSALGLGGSITVPQGGALGTVTSPYTGANPAGPPAWKIGGGSLATQDMPMAAVQQAGIQQSPQQSALNAYEIFKQSMGYQSRLQEGQRSQGAMYGAAGVYQSGARDKALARFNQDYASREFGNWIGALGNQQGLGFGAASALAGVSQGSADRLSDISQNSANVTSQAAVARAQNQGALWSGLAGIAGQTVGALSSYNRPQQSGWGTPALY